MENLARYIIRAPFSKERMTSLPGEASANTGHREIRQMEYKSKDGAQAKAFGALEWLATMCSHVPNKEEQVVRYYGYYSNAAWGKRKKVAADDQIPCILEPELNDKNFRKNWARLIQKIYKVGKFLLDKAKVLIYKVM